jgi:hypothetical protein
MIFNPMKLKQVFNKKPTDEDIINAVEADESNMYFKVLSISDSAYLCSTGAKTCYNLDVSKEYKKNLEHIQRIIGYGHDSITAHSNIIIQLSIDGDHKDHMNLLPLLYGMPAMKYMNISILPYVEDLPGTKHSIQLLISGSVRAFRYFVQKFNETYIENNGYNTDLYEVMVECIYRSFEKEFFMNFIKDGILKEDRFVYKAPMKLEISEDENGDEVADVGTEAIHQDIVSTDMVDILYKDDIYSLYTELLSRGADPDRLLNSLLETCIVTLRLKNYSRAISQQINRHQSGISQESQRYVNYSTAQFIDPLQFHDDPEEQNKQYTIKLMGSTFTGTLKELGQSLIGIYPQLKDQGLQNQDARSILPINAETKTIHTFTYKNLIHFIKTRDSQFAQQEVRQIAKDMKKLVFEQSETNNTEAPIETIDFLNSKMLELMNHK